MNTELQTSLVFRLRLALALGICSSLLAALLFMPAMMHMDFLWLDRLTVWRASLHSGDSDIVIIDIDDYSLQALAPTLGRWPWPRATHAELVEWLAAQQVKATVFDIWFSEPDVLRPEFDDYFAEVMASQTHLYLPTLLMDTTDKSHARLLNSYPISLPLQKNTGANEQARVCVNRERERERENHIYQFE